MPQTEEMNTKNRTSAHKLRSRLLKIIGGILIAIVLFLGIVYLVNVFSNQSEQKRIESYGQHITVDDKNMNVLIQGEGEETVVLLPGYGTAAPALDFKPLVDELSPHYRVIVIEPFGYGLSDETDKERTTDNIVSEIHEGLQQLHVERYILMGHSIAGIYGLEYVNQYPEEVSAFVGIDSSVPTQPGMDVKFPLKTFAFLEKSGLLRLIKKVSGDPYAGLAFDDYTKEQMSMLSNKNGTNATMLNEMKHISSNFRGAQDSTFPRDLPLILFVQASNSDIEGWIPLHEQQAKESVYGKVMTFEGGHYLHHTHSVEIVENFRRMMDEIDSGR
ncbi:alpha/beta hydrolase [Paenibacillus sp. JCM 10914]